MAWEHFRAGRLGPAERLGRDAARANPRDASAAHLLGLIARERGDLDGALARLEAAARDAPADASLHRHIGGLHEARGDVAAAARSYRAALAADDRDAEAWISLGNVERQRGDAATALRAYRRALAVAPGHAGACNNAGNALRELGRIDEATAAYRRALANAPDFAGGWLNLGTALASQEEVARGRRCVERAREKGGEPLLELRAASLCPAVLAGAQAAAHERERMLGAFADLARRRIDLSMARLAAFACQPPFNALYHGGSQRALRESFARVLQHGFPEEDPGPRAAPVPRLGLVVTAGHEGGFVRCFGALLERLSLPGVEVEVLCAAGAAAAVRAGVRRDDLVVRALPARLEAAARALREGRYDVLYHWEVGTDPVNYLLPFLRLAPLQCTSVGLQVTSGVPAMHCYLSSAGLEPDGAAGEYTEQLLRLRGLPMHVRRPPAAAPPEGARERLGLAGDGCVYACVQHPAKVHPDMDPVLAGILDRDRQATVVLKEDRGGHAGQALARRLERTVPDAGGRIVFRPWGEERDYRDLVGAADVLLDTPHYGAGFTAWDMLHAGKPVVTLPSAYQIGRTVLACYEHLGIEDCIAREAGHYVDLAVGLGCEPDRRRDVAARLRERSGALFEDETVLREHETAFETMIECARGGSRGALQAWR